MRFSCRWWVFASVALYAAASFGAFSLMGDFQKNGAAIPLLGVLIASSASWLNQIGEKPDARTLLSASMPPATALLLIGLTHFGVFMVALGWMVALLVVRFRVRALVPVLAIGCLGLLLILLFDADRALRLFTSAGEMLFFAELPPTPLNPWLFVAIPLSWILVARVAVVAFREPASDSRSDERRRLLVALAVVMLVFSLPLFNTQYLERFVLILPVVHASTIVLLAGVPAPAQRSAPRSLRSVWPAAALALVSIASTGLYISAPKQPELDAEGVAALRELGRRHDITGSDDTIVVAPHGLEWWTAYLLGVDITLDSSADERVFGAYQRVFALEAARVARGPGPPAEHRPPGR